MQRVLRLRGPGTSAAWRAGPCVARAHFVPRIRHWDGDESMTVVLLGAGASADAGVPLARALTQKAIAASGESALAYRSARIPVLLSYVVGAIQVSDTSSGVLLAELPDIERVVSAVKMLAERNSLEAAPFVREWDRQVQEFETVDVRRSINVPFMSSTIARSLTEFAVVATNSPSNSGNVRSVADRTAGEIATAIESAIPRKQASFRQLYEWLLAQVVRDVQITPGTDLSYLSPLVAWAAADANSTLATLNYDLSIESVAESLNINCDVAVSQWASTGELTARAAGAARLLKLHGSVGWTLNPSGEFAPTASQTAPAAIVYGRRDKLRPDGPFLQLLEEFRATLWRSNRLLVVGYAFGDDHINRIVHRWMAQDRGRQVALVDPYFQIPNQFTERPDLRTALWYEYGPGRRPGWSRDDGTHEELPPVRFHIHEEPAASALSTIGTDGVDPLF